MLYMPRLERIMELYLSIANSERRNMHVARVIYDNVISGGIGSIPKEVKPSLREISTCLESERRVIRDMEKLLAEAQESALGYASNSTELALAKRLESAIQGLAVHNASLTKTYSDICRRIAVEEALEIGRQF